MLQEFGWVVVCNRSYFVIFVDVVVVDVVVDVIVEVVVA